MKPTLVPVFLLLSVTGFVACGKDNLPLASETTDAGSGGSGQAGGSPGMNGMGGVVETALIDDLEDGDLNISVVEGRDGAWRTVGDDTAVMSLVVESAGDSLAAHFSSPAHTEWGGGVALSFLSSLPATGYDASKYAGLRFRARAAATTVLRVSVLDSQTDPAGGKCVQCYDYFGTDASVGTEWKEYVIDFAKLAQVGFGDKLTGLLKNELFGLQFHTGGGEPIDVWLDDISFALPGEEKPVIVEPPPRVVPDKTPVEMHGKLHVDGTQIKDEHGDLVQLKGVSTMWLNWETDGYGRSLPSLEWARDQWGLSVIRVAMGVEPDGAYIDEPEKTKADVIRIVDNAITAGVYAIIDFHDHNAANHPDVAQAFFSEMATKYAGVPNVLYETFNEPLAVSWSSVLKPYHEGVVAKIREKDADALIILGTPNWSQDVDAAANDPLTGTNLLYTLHFYACTHTGWLRNKADTALDKGLPLFVTEWGGTNADGGLNGAVCDIQTKEWTDWMKSKRIGFAAWKLDGCTTDSSCILTPDAPVHGPWTSQYLQGHGFLVRAAIMEE